MHHSQVRPRLRYAVVFLLTMLALLLTACLGASPASQSSKTLPTMKQPLSQPVMKETASPTAAASPTLPPILTNTPAETKAPSPKGLLTDFPRFAGAQEEPGTASSDVDRAALALRTNHSPAEIDAYYQKELAQRGWTLRYADGTPSGGFIQEWKQGQTYLTVSYSFTVDGPVVRADLRRIDTSKALVMLMGFPLPNGTQVTRVDGQTLELFVPQDITGAEAYFWKTLSGRRWLVQEISVKKGCTLRGCPETPEEPAPAAVTRAPAPTPDRRPGKAYHATLPDFTLVDVILLPRQADTIAYVTINNKNPVRAGLPVPVYPQAEVTSTNPGILMFETSEKLQTVAKYYADTLQWMGWQMEQVYDDQPDSFSKTWRKGAQAVTVTLSYANKKTYATITCKSCRPQVPAALPTVTPTKSG